MLDPRRGNRAPARLRTVIQSVRGGGRKGRGGGSGGDTRWFPKTQA